MNNILKRFKRKCSALGFAGILLTALMFTSCDFLNINDYIDEQLKYDSVFVSKRYLEAYMWDVTRRFPTEGNIINGDYTPGVLATDEGFSLFSSWGITFTLGSIHADNMGNYGNMWRQYYQAIRQCNIIFSRIGEVNDWAKKSEETRIRAYTRFFRAYAYYNLIVDWGPVILLYDEIPGNNEDVEYYNRPRDLYDECMEYVCSELEEAAKTLPEQANSIMDYGRPTKGAALALVARLRLIHASPLYNGGRAAKTYFGNWTRTVDGKHYVSQTYDPQRWAVAAAAAKRVIDMTFSNGQKAYELHWVKEDRDTPSLPEGVADPDYYKPFPEGAAGIDPYRSYAEMFNGQTIVYVNKEYIWARQSSGDVLNNASSFPLTAGGSNGMCVTQKVIDAYEMADGRLRTASSRYCPYSEVGFTDTLKLFSGYKLAEGVHNMYNNREMRFYASIGFSECVWPCSSTTDEEYTNLTITYYNSSMDGRSGAGTARSNNYPITGYVIKKFVNPIDSRLGANSRVISKSFPIIRYAEILLSYAEALNALGGESFTIEVDGVPQTFFRDVNEIKKAINQVRYRCGLPGLTDAEAANADYVFSKIKKERMVEFLFENRRYFDVRRWGDYEESENESIRGMNTAANKDSYYQRVVPNHTRISTRIVNRRMVLLPIARAELKRVEAFDQNPGWE
jgi:hypothetical protein